MLNSYNVLVVDDEESIVRLLGKELSSPKRIVHTAINAKQAKKEWRKNPYDIIVMDIKLPDGDGLDLLKEIKESMPDVEVIIITGHGTINTAVAAMRSGAYDYVTKPFNLDKLELIIERAYQKICLEKENRELRLSKAGHSQPSFIGKAECMRQIKYLIGRVAPTDTPVLIVGESGAGKDVVAGEVHRQSLRASQSFIIKNCAGLQKELVRSELFGHIRGAFTGAIESREGLIAFANKGTLFLDEIGELTPEVQTALLRVLENKTYRRVGDKDERVADVRFLFATNRNLAQEVRDGNFSEALYHRINVFKIELPPLKERKEDIPELIKYFLERLTRGQQPFRVEEGAMLHFMSYDWPGNIRELRNIIERCLILAENGIITDRELPKELLGNGNVNSWHNQDNEDLSLEALEKKHIARVLTLCGGNRQKSASSLGISRKTLYRKLQQYGLQ